MRYLRAVIVAAIAVGALLVPSSAIAQISSISIGQPTLGPQGASVALPFTVQCDSGWNFAFVSASVVQSAGHRLTQGTGSFSENFPGVPCAGPIQGTLTVTAASVFAYKQGKAEASVTATVANATTFAFFTKTVSQAIRISR